MENPSNLNLSRIGYDIIYYVSFHLLDPGSLPVKTADYSCGTLRQTGLHFKEKKHELNTH